MNWNVIMKTFENFQSNSEKFQILTFAYVLFHLISNFQPYLMQLNLVYDATYILRFIWLEKVICLNAVFLRFTL